jgi:putative acetyltransferase
MQPILIRPYAAAIDRERALEIWLAASRLAHPFLGEATLQRQLTLVSDVYLADADIRVAVVDARVQGFIGLLGAFIGGLFVAPEAHRLGIGRALIENAATTEGALTVEVYAQNQGALAFYAAQGFVETERRPRDDEGRPLELVQLRRPAM